MGKSRAMEAVEALVGNMMASQEYGNKLLEGQGLDSKRMHEVAPMDDGVDPGIPQNVKVTPFMKALDITWDAPYPGDAVRYANVGVTPSGGTETIHRSENAIGLTLSDLTYVDHSVRVQFVDLWGRKSGWTTSITAKPAETADFKINLLKAQQAGNLENLIPAVNLSGDNTPENMLKQSTLAQPDGSNLLPLIEVDFDQWNHGQTWSPTDTDKNGARYITHTAPAGLSASVVDKNGLKWLALTRTATATDSWYFPFANMKNRGIQPNTEFIASAYARGNAGVRVRLEAKMYKDANGTDPYILLSDVITLDGSAGGTRLFKKFLVPAGYNFFHMVVHVVDAGTTAEWTKFQLEFANGKIEPSVWTPGMITTGVLAARMLMAMDVNAATAVFKNAAISSAAIGTLTADKIVGGTINTTTINVLSAITLGTNGKLNAGPYVSLDSGGVTMARVSGYTTPSVNRAYKITSSDDLSALNFYVNGSNSKGVQLRADGSGGVRGAIALHATLAGDYGAASSARIEVVAASSSGGRGQIYADSDLHMAGIVFPKYGIEANAYINVTTISSTVGWTRWANPVSKAFRYFFPQAYISGYGWAPLGWAGTLWATTETDYIYIYNNTSASQSVWWAAID